MERISLLATYSLHIIYNQVHERNKSDSLKFLAPVVQRLDNAIHRINHYPTDSVVCFVNTYPLDSDLSGG